MRGGTSKGPFFLASDLPQMRRAIATQCCSRCWAAVTRLQIDGIGGGSPTTSKVAIISRL